jgi:hypothetical protein
VILIPAAASLVVLIVLAVRAVRRLRHTVRSAEGRDAPARLLATAVRRLPADRGPWGRAMLTELAEVPAGAQRWRFALGCVRVALFPPRPGGVPGWVAVALVAAVAATTGWAVHALLPAMQVFAVAFVLLVGAYAAVAAVLPGARPPDGQRLTVTGLMLLGVAAVIVATSYTALAHPAAASDPTHLFSVILAVTLAGYVGLAFTQPGRSGPALRYGGGAALLSAVVWLVPFLTDSTGGYAMLAGTVLVLATATVAAARTRSVGAGTQTGLWAGLVGGLLLFIIGVPATLYAGHHAVVGPATLADFRRSGLPDLTSYLISDNLGGLVMMLLLLPLWSLLLGMLGGALGSAVANRYFASA